MAYQEGQLIADRYRILKSLSSGAMTSSYLAVDTRLNNKQVAIDTFPIHSDKQVQRNRRESSVLARLDHPNILLILDWSVDKDKNEFYVISEAFPAGTLRQRHPIGTKVPLPTVISYAKQVASALQYIHDRDIVHRDVKPENIFIKADGRVALGNFGIVPTHATEISSVQTSPISTLKYMAPEQLQGKILPASDQYALGSVVYEWLSGKTPFSETTPLLLLQQVLQEQPTPLNDIVPDIPQNVATIVMRTLSKDPQNRFPSVKDFADALEDPLEDPYRPPRATYPAAPPPPNAQHPVQFTPTILPFSRDEEPSDEFQTTNALPFSRDEEPSDEEPLVESAISLPRSPRSPRSELPSIFSRTSEALTNFFSRQKKKTRQDTELSLFALARTTLERDDRAIVGNTYIIQAGISQQRQEQFQNVSFTISVQDPLQHIIFHILFHPSENITLLGAPYQPPYQSLRYNPANTDLQFISRQFRVNAPGPSYLLVNFYRERQWLKTIRFTFDGIEQSIPSTARGER